MKNEKSFTGSSYGVEFRHPTEDVSLAIGITKTGTIQRQISLKEGAERVGKYYESAIEQGGGKVISTRSLTINSIPMYDIIYTTPVVFTMDEKPLSGSFKVRYLSFNTENNVGFLMYYAPLDTYPKYEAITDKSIESIKIK